MFDWSKVKDKTAIHCKTEKEADAFLIECEKHGIRWCGGMPATDKIGYDFSTYGSKTAFFFEENLISFGSSKELYGLTLVEYSDLCKPNLPRICYILGGEDNPLKVGDRFTFEGAEYQMDKNGYGDILPFHADVGIESYILARMIEHPEKIIRQPQFSEDEIALMRGLVIAKFPWIARDEVGSICAFEDKPTKHSYGKWDSDHEYDDKIIPTEMLKQITWKDAKPFNAAEYLEGLK